DQMTTGFKGGEMIVIAARPGVGKTALALSMARHILRQRLDPSKNELVRPGYPVAFFSLEMSAQQLMFRLLSSHAGLDSEQIRRGQLSDSQITALRGVAAEISDLPLLLDESSLLSIGQLRARARRLKKMHHIEILFVDYLQLLTSGTDRARESRQVEVSEISRGLKALAMELNVPVVVLAQLNRKPEENNSDPALHHRRVRGDPFRGRGNGTFPPGPTGHHLQAQHRQTKKRADGPHPPSFPTALYPLRLPSPGSPLTGRLPVISRGYVAVFSEPHDDGSVRKILDSWLTRFERVEQVVPGVQAGNTTTPIQKPQDLIPADHMQFRVIQGGDFAWVYLTRNRRVVETTGLPSEKISLCLDVLLELPGVMEIVDQHDDRRLDELERDGLM
ncbi:MAG: hypothetical protein EBT77_00600, partial [Verrucomicrobia bacterium]|nr:hypothetical protein [Verrucomicrobiota bacterium]